MINEPSELLENMQKYILDQNLQLANGAKSMNDEAVKLQANIDTLTKKASELETLKDLFMNKVKENKAKITALQNVNQGQSKIINDLISENAKLVESSENIEEERNAYLTEISQLENALINREVEWSNYKKDFVNKLINIDSIMKSYIDTTKRNIFDTTISIKSANEKLLENIKSNKFGSIPLTPKEQENVNTERIAELRDFPENIDRVFTQNESLNKTDSETEEEGSGSGSGSEEGEEKSETTTSEGKSEYGSEGEGESESDEDVPFDFGSEFGSDDDDESE
jgi:hypothetical protein